jgi:hypothetical protein
MRQILLQIASKENMTYMYVGLFSFEARCDKRWRTTYQDLLRCLLALGSAILGSGGGGNPVNGTMRINLVKLTIFIDNNLVFWTNLLKKTLYL